MPRRHATGNRKNPRTHYWLGVDRVQRELEEDRRKLWEPDGGGRVGADPVRSAGEHRPALAGRAA